jgi:hypothetical protein
MHCPSCGFDNPEGMNFCGKCASPLNLQCPQCGFEHPPGFAFCGKCATPLASPTPATSLAQPTTPVVTEPEREPLAYTPKHLAEKILTSRSALEGERKQVTVLFADVAGFSTLSEQLDPEAVHSIMDGCFDILTRHVHH